ncbi:small conductance mechanosensitive channel [Lachnospiraceae bacterium]|nr:small conductance mechanosensitive channel [Lachnospiraceae bacterium]
MFFGNPLLTLTVSGAEELSQTISQISDLDHLQENLKNPTVFESFLEGLPSKALNLGFRVLICVVILFIGTRIINMATKLFRKSLSKAFDDKGIVGFITTFVKMILDIILVMMVASTFGVDATSIVAVLGSAGLTIGLALQGSLSNFAGGVILLWMKPFKIGDYIIEDAHKNEGTVTDIQIFYTVLNTIDNKSIMIPNGTLANTSLTNVTKMQKRQIDFSVGISYGSDLLKAKELLRTIVKAEEHIVPNAEPLIFVRELGDSAVVLGARAWVTTSQYFPTLWHLNETVKLEFDKNGIEIPFNQVDVHIRSNEENV